MLNKVKQVIYEKTTKNCVESELRGKIIYLKKSSIPIIGGEWQEIHPAINLSEVKKQLDEKGYVDWDSIKLNKVNLIFGGRKNFTILILVLIIVGMVLMQFKTNFDYVNVLKNNPCVKTCLENPNIW